MAMNEPPADSYLRDTGAELVEEDDECVQVDRDGEDNNDKCLRLRVERIVSYRSPATHSVQCFN